MMERLLEIAKKACDRAEVYWNEYAYNPVSFEDAELHDVETKLQSGLSLRVIKDDKLGFAYTKNLIDREEVLRNALNSLKGGMKAEYSFPLTKEHPSLDTYDPSIERLSSKTMVEECDRVCQYLRSRTDGEITSTAFTYTETVRVINTEGTDLTMRSSTYGIYGGAVYPGSASGIFRGYLWKRFEKFPDSLLNEIVDLYKSSFRVVTPKGGTMRAMFMPNAMLAFNWRILSGTSSKSVFEKSSPIADKLGKKIFDEKLTVYDDPLDDKFPGARSFDDEGVKTDRLTVVEKGVLKSFYYDLNYANKLNAEPTGHGYRTTDWGGDAITCRPVPALAHMHIRPGDKSFSDLVGSIDRGVIVEGALGAHSGNIPNGDYSVGLSPGLYVEKGEIVGRVKDVMVAGNIYDTLTRVAALGKTLYPTFSGRWVPILLVENASVATR
ncbi:hypothetical protein AMJ40_01890 [candidate division TA06 bacterium DG_26]|uniref:TldD/PmbA family protein n=1 Tax=candidate division TA06 bacterium DG_26 TaxID=1703771 RepID=A0A0S7WL06_UNCT6|nr:MAG: hypothetical protein AMJ40_01890 [candidate division TA06 bacterium DG_26]